MSAITLINSQTGQTANGPDLDMKKAARPERDGPPAE